MHRYSEPLAVDVGKNPLLFINPMKSRYIKHFFLLINLALSYEVEELNLFIYLLIFREMYFSPKPYSNCRNL